MNDSLHRRLVKLVGSLAVQRGDSTLASSKKFSYYADTRRATLHHETGPLIGHAMLNMSEEAGFGAGVADAVGRPTMGADPMAIAIMHATAPRGLDANAFIVREEARDHNTERRVEGPSVEGRSIVILEGVLTTGGSPTQALEAVCEAGVNVPAAAAVIDRATGAREKIEACDALYLVAPGLGGLDLRAQA